MAFPGLRSHRVFVQAVCLPLGLLISIWTSLRSTTFSLSNWHGEQLLLPLHCGLTFSKTRKIDLGSRMRKQSARLTCIWRSRLFCICPFHISARLMFLEDAQGMLVLEEKGDGDVSIVFHYIISLAKQRTCCKNCMECSRATLAWTIVLSVLRRCTYRFEGRFLFNIVSIE